MIETTIESNRIPTGHLDAALKEIGRTLNDAVALSHYWQNDIYHIRLLWPDGYCASIGLGDVASALIARYVEHRRES